MSASILFHLDFVSSYSYFAALAIDEIATRHGRVVDWRVVSLPHVFRAAGTVSPLEQPLKLAHNLQDTRRLAAMLGVPWLRPAGQPEVQWARLLFHRLRRRDAAVAARFARAAMVLRFGEGVELDSEAALLRAVGGLPVDPAEITAARHDNAAKAALVAATEQAVADGMFGAPFVRVQDEMFWGSDRVTRHLDWWLARQPPAATDRAA